MLPAWAGDLAVDVRARLATDTVLRRCSRATPPVVDTGRWGLPSDARLPDDAVRERRRELLAERGDGGGALLLPRDLGVLTAVDEALDRRAERDRVLAPDKRELQVDGRECHTVGR